MLIGGLGDDHLEGGADDDLLIGGTTSYDNHADALLAILSEWARPTGLSDRIANLQSGIAGLAGLQLGTTVLDDGAPDTLIGGLGDDWVFAFLQDKAYGVSPSDRVTA